MGRRGANKKKVKINIPSHEAYDDVPPESIHETTPCPTGLHLEGVVEGEDEWVRSPRARASGWRRWLRCMRRALTSTVGRFSPISQDRLSHPNWCTRERPAVPL